MAVVERRRVVPELLAGVTLAALALPLNLGYAEAAGLPASAGLYATILPLAVYALLAGSRHLVIGPDATIAAVTVGVVGPVAASSGVSPVELATALSCLTGVVLLVLWALRAGTVVRYLSRAVLVGFIAGLAIEVLTSQIRKILGLDVQADTWLGEVVDIVRELPQLSVASTAVGVATIVILRVLGRWAPRLPGALIALTAVTVAVAIVRPSDVAVLGDIPAGLPQLAAPAFGLDTWLELLPAALTIAALTVAEGLLLAGNAARAHSERFTANGELFAIGAANIAGAVSGCMPSGASASRTAAMSAARTTTQIPALVAAAVVVVVAVAAPGLVAGLPAAALAGLVANAVISTIDVPALRRLGSVRPSDLIIALVCAVGVLLLGPLTGIVVAVLASVVDVVRRSADAPWQSLDLDGEPVTGRFARSAVAGGDLLVLRPGGDLFFANADRTRDLVIDAGSGDDVSSIVLDLERVSDVDPSAAEALLDAAHVLRSHGRVLALSRVDADLLPLLHRYGLLDAIGPDRVYSSNREAQRRLGAIPQDREHPPTVTPAPPAATSRADPGTTDPAPTQ